MSVPVFTIRDTTYCPVCGRIYGNHDHKQLMKCLNALVDEKRLGDTLINFDPDFKFERD